MKDTLGGKGAGLAEMTNAGLPVPAGFTISTDACNIYYANNSKLPPKIESEMVAALRKLEKSAGADLGSKKKPLLVSVRSGAKFSMPGMMDTILNLGLNDETVEGLKAWTGTAASHSTAIAASSRCTAASSWRFRRRDSSTSSRASSTRRTRSLIPTSTKPAFVMSWWLTRRSKRETQPEFTDSGEFKQLAVLFKRVRNIAKNLDAAAPDQGGKLTEPAEMALAAEVDRLAPVVEAAVKAGSGYRQAFAEAAKAGPAVAKFFDDVMVMTDDLKLRDARLRLLRRLEGLILQLADVSEIVPEEK